MSLFDMMDAKMTTLNERSKKKPVLRPAPVSVTPRTPPALYVLPQTPNHPSAETSSVSESSLSHEPDRHAAPPWTRTPYSHPYGAVFLVLVNGAGEFVAPFAPRDFLDMRAVRTARRSWMLSSVTRRGQLLYPVAFDQGGRLVCGLTKPL